MAEKPSQSRPTDDRVALTQGEHSFLSEDQLKDLASLYAYGSATGFDFSALPSDGGERRRVLAEYRPSRVWDVFPNYDQILQGDVDQILRGEDPFEPGTFGFRVVEHSGEYTPPSNQRTSFGRRPEDPEGSSLSPLYQAGASAFPGIAMMRTMLGPALVSRPDHQTRAAQEDALAEIRAMDGGVPFRRGRQNMQADVYESDADMLDAVLRSGGSIDEAALKMMGTGTNRALGEAYAAARPENSGHLADLGAILLGYPGALDATGIGNLSQEEKRKYAEDLGRYETAQDFANRMARTRGSGSRLMEMRERNIISEDEYNRRIARSFGIPNVKKGQRPTTPAPTTAPPAQPSPAPTLQPPSRAEEPEIQSQPEPTPQARPQTEIRRTRIPRQYRDPFTGELKQ